VFDLYRSHQGQQSLRTVVSAPHASYTWNGNPATLRGLSSSASLKGKTLTLTVTNPSIDASRDTEIVIRGANVRSMTGKILSSSDVHAHNSFENPGAVQPKDISLSGLNYTFPPASVSKFTIGLA
jgi:alpha-N-arabinofuranosidase